MSKTKQEIHIEVRDSRDGGFHIVDNQYLNGYAKHCGVYATSVYVSLCRHVGFSQTCFPTIQLIAKEHNISERQVYRALGILKEFNIIHIESNPGGKSIYTLTNKKLWKRC
jgi:hypothetical protein